MSCKIAQISLLPAKGSGRYGEVYVAEPDFHKEALAGRLFVVADFDSKDFLAEEMANLIASSIHHNYYRSDKLLLRDRLPSMRPEHIFEAALAKTNKELAEWLSAKRLNTPPDLSSTIGLVYGDSLYFSNCGRNHIILTYSEAGEKVRWQEQTPIDETLRIIELNKASDLNSEDIGKLFASVVSGDLPPGAAVLVANEALLEYLSSKQCAKYLSKMPPNSAAEQIKHILSGINAYIAFVGLIIKRAPEGGDGLSRPRASNRQDNILDLSRTEQKTENLLAPSGFFNFGRLFSFRLPTWSLGKPRMQSPHLPLKDTVYFKRKTGLFFKRALRMLWSIFLLTANVLVWSWQKLSRSRTVSHENTRSSRSWIQVIGAIPTQLWSRLTGLDLKTRLLIIVVIVSLGGLAFNIKLSQQKLAAEKSREQYANTINEIEQKLNQAEAALLYGNQENAKQIFSSAESLLLALPQSDDAQKTRYAELKARFEAQSEKTRKISRIKSLTTLSDYSQQNSSASPKSLFRKNNQGLIYASDGAQKSIYIYDPSAKTTITATDLDKPISSLSAPTVDQEAGIAYFIENNGLIAFDLKEQSFSLRPWSESVNAQEVRSSGLFNDKIYLLESAQNRLRRFNLTASEINAPVSWIQDGSDMTTARDIAIDGNIWVLKADGRLLKYSRGIGADFALEAIEPVFNSTDRLVLEEEGRYIYILESASHRVAVYDKKGKLIVQYILEGIGQIDDLLVDPNAKLIYLLADRKLHVFPTPEL